MSARPASIRAVTISVGVATLHKSDSPQVLIERTDTASMPPSGTAATA